MLNQFRYKRRTPNKDVCSGLKVNNDRGSGSQHDKPILSNCGRKYSGKCLGCTSGCFGCGKNNHNVIDYF